MAMTVLFAFLLALALEIETTHSNEQDFFHQVAPITLQLNSQLTPKKLSYTPNNGMKPKLQHGVNYRGVDDITNYLVSEKLDGVRGYWNGTYLVSRQGNIIYSPEWFTRNWPSQAMDGELWVTRRHFQTLLSCVSKHKPDEYQATSCWRQVSFNVFDLPTSSAKFSERFTKIKQLIGENPSPYLNYIKQQRLKTISALESTLSNVINNGGEGLMLHHADAYYTVGRNLALMKLKKYQEAEAKIIGFSKGKGKFQGKVGAFIVTTSAGVTFKIGSGLTDFLRHNPPAIGTFIHYKYNGLTQAGIPRFARFWRLKGSTAD